MPRLENFPLETKQNHDKIGPSLERLTGTKQEFFHLVDEALASRSYSKCTINSYDESQYSVGAHIFTCRIVLQQHKADTTCNLI